MRICICHAPRRLEVRERHDLAAGSLIETVIALRHEEDAYALLRLHCSDGNAVSGLRQLLAQTMHLPGQISDDAVLRQVALKLGRGTLQVVALHATGTARSAGDSAAAAAPAPAPAAARRSTQQAQGPLPPPRGKDAPPAQQQEQEALDTVDQDAQAVTMEKAAEDGKPFCAVCEKAKAERAAKSAEAANDGAGAKQAGQA
ncbi:hypothetical protein HSX11_09045 [Oxalobacteraceae bacterium]|nr:hypothetical protein [Oxalobacteraceae bacterium]